MAGRMDECAGSATRSQQIGASEAGKRRATVSLAAEPRNDRSQGAVWDRDPDPYSSPCDKIE
jgi:hypothetical protein